MNTFSHILMAKIICQYVKENYGIYLDKKSFIRGNYTPDFKKSMIKNPHYIYNYLDFVKSEIKALSETRLDSYNIDEDYSRRLGVICHFCCDFFCYAHSSSFDENMKQHIKYERNIHKHLLKKLCIIKKLDFFMQNDIDMNAGNISVNIEEYQKNYLSTEQSYEKDLIFSLKVCIETAVCVIKCSGALEEKSPAVLYKYQEVTA